MLLLICGLLLLFCKTLESVFVSLTRLIRVGVDGTGGDVVLDAVDVASSSGASL